MDVLCWPYCIVLLRGKVWFLVFIMCEPHDMVGPDGANDCNLPSGTADRFCTVGALVHWCGLISLCQRFPGVPSVVGSLPNEVANRVPPPCGNRGGVID